MSKSLWLGSRVTILGPIVTPSITSLIKLEQNCNNNNLQHYSVRFLLTLKYIFLFKKEYWLPINDSNLMSILDIETKTLMCILERRQSKTWSGLFTTGSITRLAIGLMTRYRLWSPGLVVRLSSLLGSRKVSLRCYCPVSCRRTLTAILHSESLILRKLISLYLNLNCV